MSIDFLVTSLIIIVSPGTGVLYTLAAGLSRGSRASVVAAFGCTLGIVPHMAAAIMGVATLLHTSGFRTTHAWFFGQDVMELLAQLGAEFSRDPEPLIPKLFGSLQEAIDLGVANSKQLSLSQSKLEEAQAKVS